MGDIEQRRSESDYVARCKLTIKLKDDEESLRKIRQQGHFSLFHKGKPFISIESHENIIGTAKLIWLGLNDLKSLAISESEENAVLLDIVNGGIARFAVSLPSVTDDKALDEISAKHNGNFADLRAAFLYMLNADSATVARHGSALLHWMHNTRFCQRCGDQLKRNAAGNQKHCAMCGTTHYPYTSPAIITLVVEDDTDRCLLVRQPQFLPGWYTAIAGFVETGESLEDAVRREVAEEVGFEVDRLEYFNSQPWPIPKSTLMLACIAHVKPGQNIDIDRKELEDAQWVSKEELASIYQRVTEDATVLYSNNSEDDDGGKVRMIPMKGTSANDLIRHWLLQQSSKL